MFSLFFSVAWWCWCTIWGNLLVLGIYDAIRPIQGCVVALTAIWITWIRGISAPWRAASLFQPVGWSMCRCREPIIPWPTAMSPTMSTSLGANAVWEVPIITSMPSSSMTSSTPTGHCCPAGGPLPRRGHSMLLWSPTGWWSSMVAPMAFGAFGICGPWTWMPIHPDGVRWKLKAILYGWACARVHASGRWCPIGLSWRCPAVGGSWWPRGRSPKSRSLGNWVFRRNFSNLSARALGVPRTR